MLAAAKSWHCKHRPPISGRTAAAILVLVAAVDLYHFAAGFQPIGPANKAGSSGDASNRLSTAACRRLSRVWHGRRARRRLLHGLRTQGPQRLRPAATHRTLSPDMAVGKSGSDRGLRVARLSGAHADGSASHGSTGVRYLLTSPTTPLPSSLPVRLVYKGSDALIFENPGACRARRGTCALTTVAGEPGDLKALASPTFDVRRTAIIEHDQPDTAQIQAGQGSVVVDRENDAEVKSTGQHDTRWSRGAR